MERIKSNNHKCWPPNRTNLLKKSLEAYNKGEKLKSVFYETKALCIGFMANNINVANGEKRTINDDTISDLLSLRGENPLLDFVTTKMADCDLGESECGSESAEYFSKEDTGNGIKELLANCSTLPKEWNVLQIVKMTDEYAGYTTKKENSTKCAPIKFTLFCYDQSSKNNNEPFAFHLDLQNNSSTFLTAYELYQEIFKEFQNNLSVDVYQDYMKKIMKELSKLIEEMKIWLGPWITLFSGKIKDLNGGAAFEEKVYEQIDAFCSAKNMLTTEQYILLCVVARRLDLLSSENIKQAANDIAKTKEEYLEIMKLLARLKTTLFRKKFDYYPCILVLDEWLDTFPWEMLNPYQEFTRFSSLYLLFDLYDKYKDEISDGYLRMQIKTGNILINPNDDPKLDTMTKRISDFFSYWVPDWKQFERKVPNEKEISDLVTSADAYVYCGHGSSLQYMNNLELEKHTTRSVMLLFGCESVAMKLRGLVSEASATHLALHNTKCPAIFGAISIISDVWADMVSIMLISRWISSNQSEPWTPVHITEDSGVRVRVKNIIDNLNDKHDPSLLANVVNIRCEQNLALRMRAAMICRGLPIYNLANAD